MEENKIIDGKPIQEHPLYPFKEDYQIAKEVIEISMIQSIRQARELFSLEDMARIIKESLSEEDLGLICRELLLKDN